MLELGGRHNTELETKEFSLHSQFHRPLVTVMISVANLSFSSSATHPFQEMEPIRKTHSKIRRPGGFFLIQLLQGAVWFKYKVVRVVTIAQGGHCGPSKRQLSSYQKVFPKVKSFPQRARKCH